MADRRRDAVHHHGDRQVLLQRVEISAAMPPSMMSSWFCDKSAIEFAEVSRSELSILMPKALKVALRARPRGDARCDRAHGAEPHRGFLCTGTAHRSQNDR